ncbi:MAG: PhoH family protein [Acidiferrobacterales bacterium]
MSTQTSEIRFSLTPADNSRLASLCGLHDEHIRQIEESLGVEISNRGNNFRVTGKPDIASSVETFLKDLYKTTGKGELLTPSGVHVALQEMALDEQGDPDVQDLIVPTPKRKVKTRSKHQRQYVQNIQTHDINFGVGPAGTGKTYLAVACAVEALQQSGVQRIMLVRPAVEAGERLGFLPGDLEQKVEPYLRPLYDALHDMLGYEKVNRLLDKNVIELAPLAYMRGRTLNDSFIILDEAQNTTPEQMKMFLTRIGFGTTAVITGDITQVDLPRHQKSGLREVISILGGVKGISFTTFSNRDVVRHPLVQKIVEAYENHKPDTKGNDKA